MSIGSDEFADLPSQGLFLWLTTAHENARSALECGGLLPLYHRPACWPGRVHCRLTFMTAKDPLFFAPRENLRYKSTGSAQPLRIN